MSDQTAADTHEETPAAEQGGATAVAEPETRADLFTDADLQKFDADDTTAGRAIGKMLSLFFLYTVFAMSIVAWWTWNSHYQ